MEGLGYIKVALTGTDTSSFWKILQAHFGQASLIDSNDEEDVPVEEERGTSEKVKEIGILAKAELVFPMKSTPLITNGIPEDFLSLYGPKAQSCYHYQALQCGLNFFQKATACNHI